jgi:hypothetical protein
VVTPLAVDGAGGGRADQLQVRPERTLVADYILKQREYFEYPLDLEQPREGRCQKGDGHDRYHQDDEELSLTHSFLFSRSSLPANTEVLVLSSKRERSLLGRSHLGTPEEAPPGGAVENLLILGAWGGLTHVSEMFLEDLTRHVYRAWRCYGKGGAGS